MATYEADHNRERVNDRMMSRLNNGYWTFHLPPGYVYQKDKGGGKIAILDETNAPYIKEALEGFASGRFTTQKEVANFLSQKGMYQGRTHPSTAKRILENIFYTGNLVWPKWGVPLTPGKHPALISMATYEKNIKRLNKTGIVHSNKNIDEDFPLRGFALCQSCGGKLTASWSKGRMSLHPYYRCHAKGCEMSGKSLKRDDLHLNFQKLLSNVSPNANTINLMKVIMEETHREKLKEFRSMLSLTKKQLRTQLDRKQRLIDNIVQTTDTMLREVYEEELRKLLPEISNTELKISQMSDTDSSLLDAVGTAIEFISNPLKIWDEGGLEHKKLVLQVVRLLCHDLRLLRHQST